MSAFVFTVDDNIRFLDEAFHMGISPFEHPYLQMYEHLYEEYGLKTQFNMFYSYEENSFSLADCPDAYRAEFEQHAEHLHFSFHAKHNMPEFPYRANDSGLCTDMLLVDKELKRVFGSARAVTTTIHYANCPYKSLQFVRKLGIKGLIGFFTLDPDNQTYSLDADTIAKVQQEQLYYDKNSDLYFLDNDLILNQKSLEALSLEIPALAEKNVYHFMTHEQYFYKDYRNYQEDFEAKLVLMCKEMQKRQSRSVFFEELLTQA